MNRRGFLKRAAAAALAAHGVEMATQWTIGCFNRPWGPWSYDEALAGMRAAGFRVTGLLGDHKDEPFITSAATPQYLDSLKQRMASYRLAPIVAWLRTRHDIPEEESLRQAKVQIDNAARLGCRYLLTAGLDAAEQYPHFYRVMHQAAEYARGMRIQIVIKPHGGISASSDEILHCMEAVGHPTFRLWYDAGNIIHYTGKDPVVELDRVAHLVTGFCAKDCAQRGGDVMIPFGRGRVDFASVFRRLRSAGFRGPVLVECCAGKTPDEVTAGARANREYLERVLPGRSADH